MTWDYIIVGAGSAGCVLAERLSLDPKKQILLIEAGPPDNHPLIHMPLGVGKVNTDPRYMWYFQTEESGDTPAETWVRGKVLGGTSSVNGMMYFRGQAEDYDNWVKLGARGWGWADMAPCFRAIEHHELGDDGVRGAAGPLKISVENIRTPLTEALIQAGQSMGLPRLQDLNSPRNEGIGYSSRTIWKGRRQSSAAAFLRNARRRSNLTVVTGALVDHVIFEARRAVGVVATTAGRRIEYRCAGEVILCAGTLLSPAILQRSGVGPGALLQSLGVGVVHDSPGVGEHLLEHRLLMVHYDLNAPFSYNFELQGWRLAKNVARYVLQRQGTLAGGYAAVAAFARVLPESLTPDGQILFAPFLATPNAKGQIAADNRHSMHLWGYPVRSRSEGRLQIRSADPATPPKISPAYLTDEYDCAVTVALHRFIQQLMGQPQIAPLVVEREATRGLQTDEEILGAYRRSGNASMHAVGTCRMGDFPDAVLDHRLCVKGVERLRVVDGSIMPAMVSSNTNGPILASAWRAAQLILQDPR